ncbi:MAG: hypothetical protein AB1505_11680 [Candidatus Latescibacterota bacterium]
MGDLVRDQIRSEMGQLDEPFEQFGELVGSSLCAEPELVQRAALGAVLHSFYTGVKRDIERWLGQG